MKVRDALFFSHGRILLLLDAYASFLDFARVLRLPVASRREESSHSTGAMMFS